MQAGGDEPEGRPPVAGPGRGREERPEPPRRAQPAQDRQAGRPRPRAAPHDCFGGGLGQAERQIADGPRDGDGDACRGEQPLPAPCVIIGLERRSRSSSCDAPRTGGAALSSGGRQHGRLQPQRRVTPGGAVAAGRLREQGLQFAQGSPWWDALPCSYPPCGRFAVCRKCGGATSLLQGGCVSCGANGSAR